MILWSAGVSPQPQPDHLQLGNHTVGANMGDDPLAVAGEEAKVDNMGRIINESLIDTTHHRNGKPCPQTINKRYGTSVLTGTDDAVLLSSNKPYKTPQSDNGQKHLQLHP